MNRQKDGYEEWKDGQIKGVIGRRMDRMKDGQSWKDDQVERWTCGGMDQWKDGLVEGWISGRMKNDGWINGWMDQLKDG